jgi:prepilin-type N-terminal cleavage/methylation domain-containing protein
MNPKMNSSKGFSLIEVLAAMAVLSIALVALLHAHANSVRNTVSMRILLQASMLAQEKMNELEATGYELEDPEEYELESESEENDLEYLRLYQEDDFENETFDESLNWREEYHWQVFIDETDYDNIAKLTVIVISTLFEDKVPPVELISWIPYGGFEKDEDEDEENENNQQRPSSRNQSR